MANFPTSPTSGDTFHSGSNLYSWTGTAWKIVAGDRPDYGVVTFESQDLDYELEWVKSTYKLYDWCQNNNLKIRVMSNVSPIDERIERIKTIEEL